MRRVFVPVLFLATALPGQKTETEGKAWLNSNQAPAEVNVNGKWHAGEWGVITLNQADGSRDLTGTVENWDVLGVVSASKVFLLVSKKNGSIMYSMELSVEGANALAGRYADALAWKSGTRLMHLTRVDAQDHDRPQTHTDQAHVVVYRVARYVGHLIKPSVYCDDQEAALMYSGRYFTIALPPGKHVLVSSDQHESVSLDAQPRVTYYIRVAQSRSEGIRATFKVEQVDSARAANELRRLKPAETSQITRRDIVSTDLPAK
jgi:hypothetical protein